MKRWGKVRFSIPTEMHVAELEHVFQHRRRLGSHHRLKKNLRDRKFSNRRELGITPEEWSGGDDHVVGLCENLLLDKKKIVVICF